MLCGWILYDRARGRSRIQGNYHIKKFGNDKIIIIYSWFVGTARSSWSQILEIRFITFNVILFIGICNLLFEIRDRRVFVSGDFLECFGRLERLYNIGVNRVIYVFFCVIFIVCPRTSVLSKNLPM